MSFLSSILPMVAGAGLTAVSGGAINPMTAGLIFGGLQTARTGSVQKGLMAGLGAYGGAGLAGGLMGAGTAAAQNSAMANAAISPENLAATANEIGAQGASDMASSMANQAAADATKQALANPLQTMQSGLGGLGTEAGRGAFMSSMGGGSGLLKSGLAATAPMMTTTQQPQMQAGDSTMPQRLRYDQGTATPFPQPDVPGYDNLGQDFGRQQRYFPNAGYVNITPEEAKSIRGYAGGGMPVEEMSQANAVGANTGYPQADITGHAYATPYQTPVSQNVVQGTADTGVNRMNGQMLASGGIADAQYNLGGYSDGGRLLRGPGDGVSDSIPAVIGKKKPARLADGEFVVPARIVSELGNGSTEAGARKLYAMLDRVQSVRKKSIGKGKVAHNSRADKYLPA